jgi:hypothetical protein
MVLDDAGERVLMMRRHRFIVDRWVWELPGGYVDDGEDPAAAAARELEEETGWRPLGIEFVMSSQPMIGNADYPQDLYLARPLRAERAAASSTGCPSPVVCALLLVVSEVPVRRASLGLRGGGGGRGCPGPRRRPARSR